jgi:hypothetical protein
LKGLQNGRQRSKQAARLARPANSAADLFWTIDTRGRFVSLITVVGDLDFCEKITDSRATSIVAAEPFASKPESLSTN